jgi:hypothetical protein
VLSLVMPHQAERLEPLECRFAELPVHGKGGLTVAYLEHSDLGAEHCNAGGLLIATTTISAILTAT